MNKQYESVQDALIDDPKEAENLKKRSDYLILIKARLRSHPGPVVERAEHFGLSPGQVSDLQSRHFNKFNLAELAAIARKIGITARLQIRLSSKASRYTEYDNLEYARLEAKLLIYKGVIELTCPANTADKLSAKGFVYNANLLILKERRHHTGTPQILGLFRLINSNLNTSPQIK